MPNNQGLKVYQLKLKSKDDTLTLTLIILVYITKTSSNNVINSHWHSTLTNFPQRAFLFVPVGTQNSLQWPFSSFLKVVAVESYHPSPETTTLQYVYFFHSNTA